MIEINQKDYKQDEKKITDLEKELVEKKEEIPTLEATIKDYTNTKNLLQEDLPNKELEAEKKIAVADDKEKEVEKLKALLEQAEKELESANTQKKNAITSRDNTKERINNIDTLIKNNTDKITENKERIKTIPVAVENLKDDLEKIDKKIEAHREDLKVANETVKVKEQEYKEAKDTGLEKVLEYESYIKSLYEKKLEAEEEKKLEVAEKYQKEIEEYQQNLIKQNIEWEKINKLNREIAEQVRLEREQKALARKKEAEARAKILSEEKVKTDLNNFIDLLDKGKIANEDLIELVEDIKEFEEAEDRNPLQYARNIKLILVDLENDIKVSSAFGEKEKVNKMLEKNEKLFNKINKYMENMEQEKANPNIKEIGKKDTKELEKEDKGIEYQ